MELLEITSTEYGTIVGEKGPVFCRKDFLELNSEKVDLVHYFLGKDTKKRLVFAVGEENGEWRAPYSAPFTSIIELQESTRIEYYWEFIELINRKAKERGIRKITFLLPPDIYDIQANTKVINALLGNGYKLEYEEINFSLNISKIDIEKYKYQIQHNARKNLRIALDSGLSFVQCMNEEEKKQAYEIIRINRESRGYPLRMTLKQILETIKIVQHDFFLVKKEGNPLASAIVFYVNKQIVQVIYWGNVPKIEEYKPINFLAYELIKYYKNQGIEQIDIGPSSENGIPNYGLCAFKESIGCEVTGKYRYTVCLDNTNDK